MELEERKNLIIHLPVMKLIGFYHLLNPNSTRLCGYFLFKIVAIIEIFYIVIFSLMEALSILYTLNDIARATRYCFLSIAFINTAVKLYYVVMNTNLIWNCLRVTSTNFLSYEHHEKNILQTGRSMSISTTTLFFGMWLFAISGWILSPIFISDSFLEVNFKNNTYLYRKNSINIMFMISDQFYNEHFSFFYIAESISFICCAHATFLFDMLVMSMGITIVHQLKTIAHSFSSLGLPRENETSHQTVDNANTYQNEKDSFVLRMLIQDQQKIFQKMREINGVLKPVTLFQLGAEAITIVLAPLLIVMNYANGISLIASSSLTLFFTLLVVISHLYATSHLYNKINDQKDSMNFALYSTNWTSMSIENKKLLLFFMRMNNAEKTKIKISTSKIVNLEMFGSVVNTTYSVISVLVKAIVKN